MEIRLRLTGAVMTESEFRAAHPNTSFPQQLTVELLDGFEADPVLNGPQPSAGRYQITYRDGVEEIGGKWFTKFAVADMDDDTKLALDAQQAASQRAERNRRLAETDWTQGKDIPDNISNAWAAYRQELRDLPNQASFPWDINWPTQPE